MEVVEFPFSAARGVSSSSTPAGERGIVCVDIEGGLNGWSTGGDFCGRSGCSAVAGSFENFRSLGVEWSLAVKPGTLGGGITRLRGVAFSVSLFMDRHRIQLLLLRCYQLILAGYILHSIHLSLFNEFMPVGGRLRCPFQLLFVSFLLECNRHGAFPVCFSFLSITRTLSFLVAKGIDVTFSSVTPVPLNPIERSFAAISEFEHSTADKVRGEAIDLSQHHSVELLSHPQYEMKSQPSQPQRKYSYVHLQLVWSRFQPLLTLARLYWQNTLVAVCTYFGDSASEVDLSAPSPSLVSLIFRAAEVKSDIISLLASFSLFFSNSVSSKSYVASSHVSSMGFRLGLVAESFSDTTSDDGTSSNATELELTLDDGISSNATDLELSDILLFSGALVGPSSTTVFFCASILVESCSGGSDVELVTLATSSLLSSDAFRPNASISSVTCEGSSVVSSFINASSVIFSFSTMPAMKEPSLTSSMVFIQTSVMFPVKSSAKVVFSDSSGLVAEDSSLSKSRTLVAISYSKNRKLQEFVAQHHCCSQLKHFSEMVRAVHLLPLEISCGSAGGTWSSLTEADALSSVSTCNETI
ncbi:DNA mismatch repair protein MutL, partial [Striga asiatica]